VGLFRRKPAIPVKATGALLHPQNMPYWDEPWCILNALGASGVPTSTDAEPGHWTFGADDVQLIGNVRVTLLTSPTGNTWQAKWILEDHGMVSYLFDPLEQHAPGIEADAAQLTTCCDRRGGVL
jgi:hypothetical protein